MAQILRVTEYETPETETKQICRQNLNIKIYIIAFNRRR